MVTQPEFIEPEGVGKLDDPNLDEYDDAPEEERPEVDPPGPPVSRRALFSGDHYANSEWFTTEPED